jgi:hypothetical protein
MGFFATASFWAFHDNLLSSQIPENLAEVTGSTALQPSLLEWHGLTALGHFILPLLKCISSEILAANTIHLVPAN